MGAAYTQAGDGAFTAGTLTRGPWSPDHQHAGPPSAIVVREFERAGARHGLTHLGRPTGNLLRPVPIGTLRVAVAEDYVGRNAGHFSARLFAGEREVARFTCLMQREDDLPVPQGTQGHPLPEPPLGPQESAACRMPFSTGDDGYGELVENRLARGRFFDGPSAAWFRMRHALLEGEQPSPYQRVAVAADSGNGISAALDFGKYTFVNCDLSIHLLRRPVGEWILLDARTQLAGNGCGIASSELYDEQGLIGRAMQSLAVRRR